MPHIEKRKPTPAGYRHPRSVGAYMRHATRNRGREDMTLDGLRHVLLALLNTYQHAEDERVIQW